MMYLQSTRLLGEPVRIGSLKSSGKIQNYIKNIDIFSKRAVILRHTVKLCSLTHLKFTGSNNMDSVVSLVESGRI